MSETPQTYRERLFSEPYWEGDYFDPSRDLGPREGARFANECYKVLVDDAKAQEIGNVVLSLKGGGTAREIPEGEPLPMPLENTRQVVKVVTDTHYAFPRFGKKPRHYRQLMGLVKMWQERADLDFDTQSEFMEAAHMYRGPVAIGALKNPKDIIVVERAVGYLRAATAAGTLGALLASAFLEENHTVEEARPSPLPQLRVGDMYKADKRALTKICSATLLEATGVRWTHNTSGGSKKKQMAKSRLWLPAVRGV